MRFLIRQINKRTFRMRRNYLTLEQLGLRLSDTVNLSSWLTRRSGLTMTGDVGSAAQILPSCGLFSGSSYASRTITNFGSSDLSGYVEARYYYTGDLNRQYLFASGDVAYSTRHFSCRIENGLPTIYVRDGMKGILNSINAAAALSVGWHTIRFSSDGHAYHISVDGVDQTLVITGLNDGKWIGDVSYATYFRDNISIGALVISTINYSTSGYIDYVDYNGTHRWLVTGTGRYVYDLIGDLHMTWNLSPSIAYHSGASSVLLTEGYSRWRAAGLQDEIVPYYNGSPIDVSSFLTGYTKVRDHEGSASRHNLAPSLIDLPHATYDRSNTLIHNAQARSGYDYDVSHPNRWRPEDLVDPRVYYEWRNVGYRGMIGAKTENDGTSFAYISELFAYGIDKLGDDQYSIMRYDRVSNFALTSGGVPVLDGDNYVILL